MNRSRFSSGRPRRGGTFRPQLEVLEDRLAPGSLHGGPHPDGNDRDNDVAEHRRENDEVARMAAIRTTSPVVSFTDPSIVLPGSSTLIRTAHGVTIHLETSGLTPGHAYTFWWVVLNPGTTNEVIGRAAGLVVGRSGIADISAHLNVGQTVGDPPLMGFEGTLQDARRAEISLVVRDHGPAIPGQVFQQTHTFQPELGVGPPADVRITIHLPPAA